MKIQDVDKRLSVKSVAENAKIRYYDVPNEKFSLYGVYYDTEASRFVRMDNETATSVSEGVKFLNAHTAGGRLRFSTNSEFFSISVTYDNLEIMSHMAIEGQGGFILVEENDDGTTGFFKILPPQFGQGKGFSLSTELPKGRIRNYILWFPLYNGVNSLKIGLSEGAEVGQGRKYADIKPILYYGSSITQGGCASRPDDAYQALISKWSNVDFINLGFSGNAKAEDEMTDYLASLDCSVFVCDYDHNAPTAQFLKDTHFRLYERYRAVKKDVPILFISSPGGHSKEQEDVRYEIIRQTYLKAKRSGDKNVYLLDGRKFFAFKDGANCTVDGCHPNDHGFYIMAKAIYKKLCEINADLR